MTGTKIEMDPQCRGEYFAAITKFKDYYGMTAGFGRFGLNEGLDLRRKVLGKNFRVVRIYERVSCFGIVKTADAARDLQDGKTVDLGKILSK